MFDEFFARHGSNVGMLFSAGKDSAACLYLLEKHWDKIVFIWGNPGNPYPETIEYMAGVAKMVPRFIEVVGEQPEYIRKNGHPVDILPVYAALTTEKMVPFSWCCSFNLWNRTQRYVQDAGLTGLIRGQKDADLHKSSAKSGDEVEGVEYLHPLEVWTDLDVARYLGERIPASYKRGVRNSLDCMNCTAYADPARIRDLESINPAAVREIRNVHFKLVQLVSPILKAHNV